MSKIYFICVCYWAAGGVRTRHLAVTVRSFKITRDVSQMVCIL